MAVTKEKKAEILQELEEKFQNAKAVYFSNYRGLTVKDMTALRKKLRDQKIEYCVAKKTLMKLAVKNKNFPEMPNELMDGPVGAAFGYDDAIAPVKVLYQFAKENDKLELLGGLVDGKYMSKAEIKSLATLPSREELLAKLVGSFKAPVSGFHGVLAGVLRNFVYAMKAVQEKKEGQQ